MLGSILKTSLVLALLIVGCRKKENVYTHTSYNKQNRGDTIVKSLRNEDYSLSIEILLSKDTLEVVDYKKDKYSSPIIVNQRLSFFQDGKLLKHHKLPVSKVKVKTITNTVLEIVRTPIYKACLSKNSREVYYILHGAEYDYCNGSNCLEFVGIYTMSGGVVYEGFTNEKKEISLKDIVAKNKIELNKLSNCNAIDDF